jgi:hypothetical protein
MNNELLIFFLSTGFMSKIDILILMRVLNSTSGKKCDSFFGSNRSNRRIGRMGKVVFNFWTVH